MQVLVDLLSLHAGAGNIVLVTAVERGLVGKPVVDFVKGVTTSFVMTV